MTRSLEAAKRELSNQLAYCERIASQGKNNLWTAAQLLRNEVKYSLFLTTYASMRVVDDLVDERFLALPADLRASEREVTLRTLETWLRQAKEASEGSYRPSEGDFEPEVFEALTPFLCESELGCGPWLDLAESMRRDIQEIELGTWEDFVAYCRGATVAPASVLVYILGCRVEKGVSTRFCLERSPEFYAKDMATFCYVVHILRDLSKDASKDAQLLSIPRDAISMTGLDLPEFKAHILRKEFQAVAPVLKFLVGKAGQFEVLAGQTHRSLSGVLEPMEYGVLDELFGAYVKAFRRIRDYYEGVLNNG
jgi:phytoene synthase